MNTFTDYVEPTFIKIEFKCHDLLEKFCIAEGISYTANKAKEYRTDYGVTGKITMYFESAYRLANKMMAFGSITESEDKLIIPWNRFGAEDNETDEYLKELNELSPEDFKVVVKERNEREYLKSLREYEEY